MNKFLWPLTKEVIRWQKHTIVLMFKANKNRDIVGSASVEYLMYCGYIFMAYMWAMKSQTAYEKIAAGSGDINFYQSKISTAEFYFERIFPRVKSLSSTMMKNPQSVMKISEEQFF